MSYDFWLTVDAGGPEPATIEPRFDDRHPALGVDGHAGNVLVTGYGFMRAGNYTSNVGPIWRKCLTAAGADDSVLLRDLDGKPAGEVAPLLKTAVEWGVAHLPELEPLNPPNGWGDARGALTYLWDIQRLCEAHPKGTLRFSW